MGRIVLLGRGDRRGHRRHLRVVGGARSSGTSRWGSPTTSSCSCSSSTQSSTRRRPAGAVLRPRRVRVGRLAAWRRRRPRWRPGTGTTHDRPRMAGVRSFGRAAVGGGVRVARSPHRLAGPDLGQPRPGTQPRRHLRPGQEAHRVVVGVDRGRRGVGPVVLQPGLAADRAALPRVRLHLRQGPAGLGPVAGTQTGGGTSRWSVVGHDRRPDGTRPRDRQVLPTSPGPPCAHPSRCDGKPAGDGAGPRTSDGVHPAAGAVSLAPRDPRRRPQGHDPRRRRPAPDRLRGSDCLGPPRSGVPPCSRSGCRGPGDRRVQLRAVRRRSSPAASAPWQSMSTPAEPSCRSAGPRCEPTRWRGGRT